MDLRLYSTLVFSLTTAGLLAGAPLAAEEPAGSAQAAKAATTNPAPQWVMDEIAFMTRDGGRWIASNARYQSDDEPFDAYGMEWTKGYANSMTARLFGLMEGEETGDFWRFRQYWHPGDGKMVLEQFGFGGAFGTGTMARDGKAMLIEQTFYGPDGSVSRSGHKSINKDDDTHITESFTIIDGEWKPNRLYEWHRARAAD